MNSKNILIPALCAVAGVTVGFVGGFIFAKAKYKKAYEKKYEDDIYALKKKDVKDQIKDDGHKTTEEEAKKIAESFPSELWTEQFKKSQEKKKEYKNICRENGYIYDTDGNKIDKSEVFDNAKFEKENYKRCKEEFDERVKRFSEFSGISLEALLQGTVSIVDGDDYYENAHDAEPTELEWDPKSSTLRDIDGDILEPEITFGDDWDSILRRIEDRPDAETWVYDERIEEYYLCKLAE